MVSPLEIDFDLSSTQHGDASTQSVVTHILNNFETILPLVLGQTTLCVKIYYYLT
jgi:hypothetical protein